MEKQYAGLVRRAIAYAIDDAMVRVIVVCFLYTTFPSYLHFGHVLIFLAFIIIDAAFSASKYQATPGKMLMKIKISTPHLQRLTFPKALLRAVIRIAPLLPMYIVVLNVTLFAATHADLTDISQQELMQISPSPWHHRATFFLILIWALVIGKTKEKTGIHDIICKTRVYRT